MKYRLNYSARSLRLQRTHTIGVLAQEIGYVWGALVISGIEENLRAHNFFFLTMIHRQDQKLQTYAQMLLSRGVEGFITTDDTSIKEKLALPTVAVRGYQLVEGVTNVTLDRHRSATLALSHLIDLGRHEIAVLRRRDG
jgi:DNA-binding LacI/PurR family transcriptional regulator